MQKQASSQDSLILLGEYRDSLNTAIEAFLDTWPAVIGLDASTLSAHSLDIFAKLREYTLRPGKRIRGTLAAAAYDDIKHTHLADAGLMLGVVHELMQSYVLIIDDVTDKSELRRGKPTVHREYAAELDHYSDEHEANVLALNVGLVTQHLANIGFVQIAESAENIAHALRAMHRNYIITGLGQVDDISQKVGRAVSQGDVVRMYTLKTGHYTFVNPLQTGLFLAGVHDQQAENRVEDFGRAAGVAFQMHDDYLGIYGESETTGKANTDDLQEGKYTILVQYVFEHGKKSDIERLQAILTSKHVSAQDLETAKAIFESSGATLFTQMEAKKHAETAKQYVAATSVWSDSFKTFLADLVDYSVSRKS